MEARCLFILFIFFRRLIRKRVGSIAPVPWQFYTPYYVLLQCCSG